jgi:hypothetical protein
MLPLRELREHEWVLVVSHPKWTDGVGERITCD